MKDRGCCEVGLYYRKPVRYLLQWQRSVQALRRLFLYRENRLWYGARADALSVQKYFIIPPVKNAQKANEEHRTAHYFIGFTIRYSLSLWSPMVGAAHSALDGDMNRLVNTIPQMLLTFACCLYGCSFYKDGYKTLCCIQTHGLSGSKSAPVLHSLWVFSYCTNYSLGYSYSMTWCIDCPWDLFEGLQLS